MKNVKNLPKKFFKKNRLWCSPSSSFNDPFDSYPYYEMEYTPVDIDNYIKLNRDRIDLKFDDTKNYFLNLNDNKKSLITNSASKDQRDALSACCFSKNNNNILMWSHYADSHRGICLRFNFKHTGLKNLDNPFDVIYKKNRPVLNRFKNPEDHEGVFEATNTKSNIWEYENEVRIFPDPILKGGSYINFPEKCLDGIIFGACCSIRDRKKVVDWIRNRNNNVELLEAIPNQKEYSLEIVKFRAMDF